MRHLLPPIIEEQELENLNGDLDCTFLLLSCFVAE